MEKIRICYNLYVKGCRFSKLWEFVIPILDAPELSLIEILYIMEFICRFRVWKEPESADIKYCLMWMEEGVFETCEDVMGVSQYKIKEKFLGD